MEDSRSIPRARRSSDGPGDGLSWFAVRSHYRGKRRHVLKTYEERIVIFAATDAAHALAQAKEEAAEYAGANLEVLSLFRVSRVRPPTLTAGVTVFSELRDSNLDPEPYLTAFYDTGTETTVWL